MGYKQLLFCGNHPHYLKEELTKNSNKANGGIAFRIPSLIHANGTLVAAIDRASTGADWGYIEIAIRRSEDGGKTWSDLETIVSPPARETKIADDCYGSGFFIDPCMAIAENGDIIMIVDFWPECKGLHKKSILDKHKAPYAEIDGKMLPVIYSKTKKPYYIQDDGTVIDKNKQPTNYRVKGFGSLYEKEKYVGNIFLYGKEGVNEAGVELTFGAPLTAPKRSYVYMLRSSDNGKTWSQPKDITHMFLKRSDGTFLGVAPGVGITTKTGRIIMPLYVDRKSTVTIYSDDNGETWHRTEEQPYSKNIDEWQMLEAPDGTILGFGRQKKPGKTPVTISKDNGTTWKKSKKTELLAVKCQKSVLAVGEYIFSTHTGPKERADGELSVGKLIKENGAYSKIKWFKNIKINDGFFAYSCLTQIDENTIGVMYEAEPSSYLLFETYKIDELVK